MFLIGGGFHLCIGVDFAVKVITDTLKIVYSLKNVRRAAGDAGRLTGTTKKSNDVEVSASSIGGEGPGR
jgi:linoleate 10R-lipoxygenase